jgi:hypothetical protein
VIGKTVVVVPVIVPAQLSVVVGGCIGRIGGGVCERVRRRVLFPPLLWRILTVHALNVHLPGTERVGIETCPVASAAPISR